MGIASEEQQVGSKPVVTFKWGPLNAMVLFHADDEGNYTSIQVVSIFKARVDLTKLNDWNQGKRFCRAYRDKDGDVWVVGDLDLSGGLTKGTVREFLNMHKIAAMLFFQENSNYMM